MQASRESRVVALALSGAGVLFGCGARTGLLIDPGGSDGGTDGGVAFDAAHPLLQLALGSGHACLLTDGRVRCWGRNDSGQVGDGTTDDRARPVAVDVPNAVEIAAAFLNTCVRLADGTVRCWGTNTNGEVGIGTLSMTPVLTPAQPAIRGVVALANRGSGEHLCVRLGDDTARCWGSDFAADFGEPSSDHHAQPVPTRVDALNGVHVIAVGGNYTCGIFPGASVECVGNGGSGQLGDGVFGARETWGSASGLTGVSGLAAGNWHACAIMQDHSLRCWGVPFAAGIGGDGARPTPVPGVANVIDVVCAGFSTCALLADHTVSCWGSNKVGELGNGMPTDSPVAPGGAPVLGNVQQIAGGDGSFCAILADGRVKCWGSNKFGQIGDGTNTNRPVPTEVSF